MKKRSFKNSDMDRASLKRRFFRGLVAQKPSRLRAYTHAMDDRPRSINITRAVAAIIIVHLIALGGILLHEHYGKTGTQAAADQAPPHPPLAQQDASKNEIAKATVSEKVEPATSNKTSSDLVTTPPLTVEELSATATTTLPAGPIMNDVRTNNAPAVAITNEIQAVADEEIQAIVVNNGATASTSLARNSNYHHVVTGDSWKSVATLCDTTEAELKQLNPRFADLSSPPAGNYLALPAPKEVVAVTESATAAATTTYTVAGGDNMIRIARKHGMTLDEILKLNNISTENAGRINVGQKLRVRQR